MAGETKNAIKNAIMQEVGRKKYAFGLSWFVVEEGQGIRSTANALNKASDNVHDLVIIRKAPIAQFALGAISSGLKEGAISAAAVIADSMPVGGSWLIAMPLPTGFWISAGHEGTILNNGDRVVETEEEARAIFDKMLGSAGGKTILAPKIWGTPFEEITLEMLAASSAKRWTRLASTSPVGAILKASAILAGLGATAFIASLLIPSGDAGPTAEQIAEAQRRFLVEQESAQSAIYAELDANRPWLTYPDPQSLLANCLDAMRDLPLDPIGFETTEIVCVNGAAEAVMARDEGYISWIERWVKDRPGFSLSVSMDGEGAFLSLPFDPLAPQQDGDLERHDELVLDLHRAAQVEGGTITVGPPSTISLEEYPEYRPYFATSTISITTLNPEAWIDVLSKVNGVAIDRIALIPQNLEYTIEGKLHVTNR